MPRGTGEDPSLSLRERVLRRKKEEFLRNARTIRRFKKVQAKEHRENLREERLRQRELEKLQSFEKKETNVDKNFSSGLEKFKVDVTKEN